VQDKLAVNFGAEITKIVPGYVSTEVDARLSFDTQATIEKAKSLIKMYEEMGISKDRILIKIAATWEGIKAAEVLERDHNITCNLTLVFHLYQAVACAEAGITLISPFVGRIMDWYKKQQGVDHFKPEEDPGVVSVTQIYNYYKKYGYNTIVMGASFRNIGEIQQLAGCDRLTIAPALIDELIAKQDKMEMKLDATASALMNNIEKIDITEQTFRWNMNENPMATEKLAEVIRSFAADIVQLEMIIQKKMQESSKK
jgi:transaldolase